MALAARWGFAGWTVIDTPASIILALVVSLSVGLLFDVHPAMRAATLDPVQSLHFEQARLHNLRTAACGRRENGC